MLGTGAIFVPNFKRLSCTERHGPCWFPHKPEDCSRCQKDRRGLCYNPRHWQ